MTPEQRRNDALERAGDVVTGYIGACGDSRRSVFEGVALSIGLCATNVLADIAAALERIADQLEGRDGGS